MGNDLNLTRAQQFKVMQMQSDWRTQAEVIHRDVSIPVKQRAIKMRALFASMENKFTALLTPAQRKKREELRKFFINERRKQRLRAAI